MDAAHAMFLRGEPDVSMEEIAAEAGLGVATVYRRFPSKRDLVRAVLDREFDESVAPALHRVASESDPRAAMITTMEAALDFASRERLTFAAAANIGLTTMHLARRFAEPLGVVIRQGQQQGAFRDDLEPEDALRLLLMLTGTFPSFAPGHDGWRRYMLLLVDGLAPQAARSELPAPTPVIDHFPGL
ncbi:helix-turn-helix transcriptional regulator [Streptomyces sp. ISL-14]|nr:helix-turn-helix transcriptional regulator [Streptomyces sp. ISL-14]